MRRLSYPFGAAIVLLAVGLSGAARASEYVPNDAADSFRYKNTRFGSEIDVTIDGVSGGWRHYTQFAGLGSIWVWTGASHEYVYVWNGTTYELLANFDDPVGTRSQITIGCNRGAVTIGAKGETVATPAGTFAGAIRLDFTTSCADAGLESAWFAKGVGPVKWIEQNFAGPVTVELISGTIGGTTYPVPAPAALKVSGTIAEVDAVINLMPGPSPRAPKTVAAQIEVSNQSGSDLSFVFRSGQSFEIRVVDSTGATVSRWSRGRMFTQAIRHVTLKAHDGWTFGGEVELTTDAGAPLPQGDYTVVIELKASPQASVAFPLKVSHVY